ncbi:MAG TPA: thrombospondin type 3 repeat-containing protein, partial [Dongiaceae bacterium]|nr:thrombospondin type 3 repeat-containing protein [Dongiaceae bacterium]
MMLWAGKAQIVDIGGEDSQYEQALLKAEARYISGQSGLEATYPPAEFSPFGGVISPRQVSADRAADMLASPTLGDVEWNAEADDVTASLKPGLRWGQNEMTKVEHGHLRPGLNFVRLSQAAMTSNPDAAMRTLGEQATVLYAMPRSTFLVKVEAKNMHLLRQNPDIDRMRPMEPAMKVSATLGARPEIMRARATDPNLRVWVTLVPGSSTSEAARSISAMQGVSNVTENLFGGTLHMQVHYGQVDKIARRDDVLRVEQDFDHMLSNAENVPTIQAGSAEDANFLRPFDMVGVDGGGIDTNADGRRINNGSDAVPPQIVTIVDNGISVDTPNFSQTATQVSIPITAPIGPTHRKVHAIQNAGDSGTSCDAQLSGGGTHGNVVAAAIGAYSSQLGFFVSRAGYGGSSQPRSENLDGIARGSRILMEDAATTSVCTLNSLVERGGNVSPGLISDRLNAAICPITPPGAGTCATVGVGGGTETHLAVLPFGAPSNFGTNQFLSDNGTYTAESNQIDTFLYNNRDFMVFSPVGNNGALIGTNRLGLAVPQIPDLFNGSLLDEDPNTQRPIQTASPSTAKNLVSVGGSTADCSTFFGGTDCEGALAAYTSRGPATPQSLRMAPIVTAPQFDFTGTPYTSAVAVFRSNDNDNLAPIDAQLDESNFGTSYAAAYMTGAGAIIRDYFAQGFFPTGSRADTDRIANISGAFVKAALAASADFNEGGIGTQNQDLNERDLRRTRALNLGTVNGVLGSVNVGIMGNSEQGYGRAVLTDVLPLSNWPDNFVLHPVSLLPVEYPAAGLLAYDRIATAEPLINNTTQTSVTHTFRLAAQDLFTTNAGAVVVRHGQLRIALAWPDLPSPAGAGGPLINDLDLIVTSPGPDNCLASTDTKPDGTACPAGAATDNVIYDGNNYDGGRNNATFDQWSRARGANPEVHDFRNPIEAVHLVGDSNFDGDYNDSTLFLGRWTVTVQRGRGPAQAAQIPLVINGAVNEDANGNSRLDAGEDLNANGLLDQPGQPYALVVSGPVFNAEASAISYPSSQISFSANRYGCASNATLDILDITGSGSTANIKSSTTFQVLDASGVVVDSEANFNFTQGTPASRFTSALIPIRLAGPAVVGNGILEADTGYTIVATYNRAGQRTVTARAAVSCTPDLINANFLTADNNNNAFQDQTSIGNGCDNDDNLDAGEVVTYGIALQNRSRVDTYADVVATLTPTGPGAAAIRVLDSPKNFGTFPGNGTNGIFFHVFVDPTIANGLSVANRVVTMNLTLDSLSKGRKIGRQSYSFTNAINSDRQEFYYSTDFPTGGREVRDLNRNLVIDPPDTLDPFLTFIVPDEDVTFSSLFAGTGAPASHFTNELGEDLDLSGTFTGTERDLIPNGAVDKGVLNSNNPVDPLHRIPWNFDNNNGGWNAFRHPASLPGSLPATPVWEYLVNRPVCGFQSAAGVGKFGIWHAGDGNPATPSAVATACDNHAQPRDSQTTPKVEMIMDVLESPILAKVNQNNDARGFAYTVEFQRLGFNENIQTLDGYAGGGVNIDNNADSDNVNSLLGEQLDQYYTRRTGGWTYGQFRDAGQYFPGTGINPGSTGPHQRTFGPFTNPDLSTNFTGDETGFSGFTANNNPNSSSPIPTADPDFLAYPVPGAPVAGICDGGGVQNDQPCDPANQTVSNPCIAAGGVCTAASNTVAGPVRNWDASLVDFEGGWASLLDPAPTENYFFNIPGKAGNRWQIGIGFWAIESATGDTDYGKSIDDVVFEWLEWHPEDEAAMGHPAACSRYNSLGNPSGGQCATITADRSTLYECDEAVEITVYDAKCISGVPLGGPCTTDAQCGGGGNCTADNPSVNVSVATESDSVVVDYQGTQVFYPNSKLFTLNAVAGSPGLFRGSVIFSTTTNDAAHVFTVPGTDSTFTVYYHDPLCDGDRDGQAAEDNFNNVDGDGVPDASDKCPQIYDPGQADADGDGLGDLCDNCPNVSNNDQADANADGVGDACEFDDVDGDTFPNELDNCPDVRNPNQSDIEGDGRGDLCDTLKTSGTTFGTSAGAADCVSGTCTRPTTAVGAACTVDEDCIRSCNAGTCANTGGFVSPLPAVGASCVTHADCYRDIDRDGDGVVDALDNCVVSDNGPLQGPNNQTDSDIDGLGNVCDGDCTGATEIYVCRGSGISCPVPETNQAVCANANGLGNVCEFYLSNTGSCSATNDDYDADGNSDQDDNCTTVANPAIVAGTNRQRDNDRDGLGDACDPTGTFDDAGDGIPDDVVNFQGSVSCRNLPLANLTILSADYVDLDGDHDPFPDTGETGRIRVTVRNDGVALTDATVVLTSSDPDVACITSPSVVVGNIAAGATAVVGSLLAGPPGFTMTSSNAMLYTGPPQVAPQSTLCITVVANETLGANRPTCFNLLSDLN